MYRTILVPLDGSPLGEKALPLATKLAQTIGAKLVLIRSAWVPRLSDIAPEDTELHVVRDAEDYLSDIAFKLLAQGMTVETGVPFAPANEGILMEIELRKADLVVMSTHGRSGISRLIYGSVAEAVLAHSPVPVMLIHVAKGDIAVAPIPAKPKVLLPLDGSECAESAIPYATALVEALDGSLVLLRVVVPPAQWVDTTLTIPYPTEEIINREIEETREYLNAKIEQLQAEGLMARSVIEVGHAPDTILNVCDKENIDVVVMATHGRTGFSKALFGSVALSVLHQGYRPLLVVRPQIQPKKSEQPTPDEKAEPMPVLFHA